MPARNTKIGAQKCVTQRVRNRAGIVHIARVHAAAAEEVACVIEHHDGHDEAAQKVDAVEPRSRLHKALVPEVITRDAHFLDQP